MFSRLKLSHFNHSGKLKPHEHTSYLPLGILLLVVGFALTVYTASAADRPGPASESISVSGVMPGNPPTIAAVIQSPANQQRFSTSPVTFTGSCPAGDLVEIYKNSIFAGSTICSDTGNFSLDIDLLVGQNIMTAKVYDALNQTGPESNPVTVYYDALPAQAGPLTSLDFGNAQLILSTDAVYRGIFPDQEFNMPISILGGTAPYAINVLWGDAENDIISRGDNISFNASHSYLKAGTYQVSIQASDAEGRVAFITVAVIVNGQPTIASTTNTVSATTNQLLLLWPLYTSIAAIVASFWLGERREKHILSTHGQLQNS